MRLLSFLLILLLLQTMPTKGADRAVLILGENSKEISIWKNEILDPLNATWSESAEQVEPAQWADYAAVIVAGGLPHCLEENAQSKVENYLDNGGVLIAVGRGLHSLVFPPETTFATKFPNWAVAWIGAERCFYPNNGWTDYEPQPPVWPWSTGIPFQSEAYGTHSYGLLGLSSAENVLGQVNEQANNALIAVNRIGHGAFIFVGQPASSLKDREIYSQAMREALKVILETRGGQRQ